MTEEKRVVIVGAGGIGSLLSRSVAMTLEFRLPGSAVVIVDGDTYEAKNKQRQFFDGMGNKAEVLAAELAPQFEKTFIIPLAAWVVDDDKAGEVDEGVEADGSTPAGKVAASKLVQDGDVVFAVVDNFKARRQLVDAAAKLDNVDVFLGGNDDRYFGSMYHYARRNGADVTDNPVERMPELQDPPDRNPGELSCQERAELDGGTQLLATNMVVTSLLLGRFDQVIVNDADPSKGNEMFIDLEAGLAQSYDRSAVSEKQDQLV